MIEVKFKIDIKTARKAFVLIDEEIPSDEVIIAKLNSVVIDLTKSDDDDIQGAELGFMIAVAKAFDKEN